MKRFFITSALGLLLLSSCNSYQVVSDYDQNVSFAPYKTYQLDAKSMNSINMNDIDKSRINSELTKQLSSKGLQESSSPDLIVKLKASYKIIKETNAYGGGYSPWGWGWGFGGFGSFGYNRSFTSEYPRGGLEIDFVDAKTNKLVWQGKGLGIDVDSPIRKSKQIPEMISEIMANYPPKVMKQAK